MFEYLHRAVRRGRQAAQKVPGRFGFAAIVRTLPLVMIVPTGAVLGQDGSSTERQLLQLAEYIGVDYSEAIADGEVINEGEYLEMLDFSTFIVEQIDDSAPQLIHQTANTLQASIEDKVSPDSIRFLTNELRSYILSISPGLSLPATLLPASESATLFAATCSSCHGQKGDGAGPASPGLDPPPTDFTDRVRAANRSLVGLHDAIAQGLEGTAMVAFPSLTEQERWSLAFYVAGLSTEDSGFEARLPETISLEQYISMPPTALLESNPYAERAVWQLRNQPHSLFAKDQSPLATARSRLTMARSAYNQENYDAALQHTVSAYLDGFELIENTLDTRDSGLRKEIEASMLDLRGVMRDREPAESVSRSVDNILAQLNVAETTLNENALSTTTLFGASVLILLREGLEALLVILALVTVLKRTRREDALKYVHTGWVLAVLSGIVTWWIAQELISISGVSREIMEGLAALLAAVVLFYVGFWMHSKSQAKQWQAYINRTVDQHLSNGTLWGLASLAFIAVYREVFETVLFYQALFTQAPGETSMPIISGFVVAAVGLCILACVLTRYSVKMPITRFFAVTTWLMLGLSFILLGKAVAALQEANILTINRLPVDFSFPWLGIYSTWQGILAQLILIGLGALLLFWNTNRARSLQSA